METTLSSKGRVVLPAEARRRLRLAPGERLEVEVREGGIVLRPVRLSRSYQAAVNPKSGLTVMASTRRGGPRVTAEEIAKLHAELL